MTVAIIVTTFVGTFVLHPDPERHSKNNEKDNGSGFEPDWECVPHPLVGPICIKKMRP